MFQFLRPARGYAALAASVLALCIAAEILAVQQTAEAVNRIKFIQLRDSAQHSSLWSWLTSSEPDVAALRAAIGWLAAYMLCGALLAYHREVSRGKLSMQVAFHMREATYDKLQRVGLAFHDRITTGELINRALSDLQHVREFTYAAILVPLDILLIVVGYFAVLLTRSPWVALLALAPLPFWTIYVLRFSRRIQPVQKSVMEAGDQNVSILTENIAGVHVVKSYGTQALEIQRYAQNADEFFRRVMQRIRLYANFTPATRAIAAAAHLLLFLAAGILIVHGRMLAGDLLILGAALGAILGRLQQIAVINEQYQSAIVSARRLYDILQAQGEPREPAAPRPLPPGPGAVEFERVSFGYDPAKPVLRELTFRVEGGSVIAIVGATGAGKTTLVNLIARFYDPQQGSVRIDGVDLREISFDSLRSQVAYVFQEPYLFSDTIEANVAYGRPDALGPDTSEIQRAAQLAQAIEFIDTLPQRYQTTLGERGITLSGGQRQRLTIARAILSDPRILILDDATASVDPQTEELIVRGMRFAMRQRTTFIIAHRLSTVRRADRVLVLEHGRITQQGTHAELMARDGHYRDVAEVQLFGDGLDRDAEGDLPSHLDRVGADEQREHGRDEGARFP